MRAHGAATEGRPGLGGLSSQQQPLSAELPSASSRASSSSRASPSPGPGPGRGRDAEGGANFGPFLNGEAGAVCGWGGFSSKAVAQKSATATRRPSRTLASKSPNLDEASLAAASGGGGRLATSNSAPSLQQGSRRRPSRQLWDYNAAVLGVGSDWVKLTVPAGDYETSQQNCLHDLHQRHVGARLETPTGKAAADLVWGANEGPRSTTGPWRRRPSNCSKAARRPSKEYLALPPHEEPHQELKQLQELINKSHHDLVSAVPGGGSNHPPWPRTAWTTASARGLEESPDPAGFLASQAGFVARFRQFRGSALPVVSEPLAEGGEEEEEEELEERQKQHLQQQKLLLELQLHEEQQRRQSSKGSCITASTCEESDDERDLAGDVGLGGGGDPLAFQETPSWRLQRKLLAGRSFSPPQPFEHRESASRAASSLPMSASASASSCCSSSCLAVPSPGPGAGAGCGRRPAKHSSSFRKQSSPVLGLLPSAPVSKLPLAEIFQSGKLASSSSTPGSARRDARAVRGGGG